jgi:hypothetical protein
MSRPRHPSLSLAPFVLAAALTGLGVPPATAVVTIPEGDLNPLTAPCSLTLTESNQLRVLTWGAVAGAANYKVGLIRGAEVIGLAETSGTTYTHSGFDPGDCVQYVVVAYDGAGQRICAAQAPLTGRCH